MQLGRRNAAAEQQRGRARHDGLPGAASKQMWARFDGGSTIKLLRWWRIDAVRARANNGDSASLVLRRLLRANAKAKEKAGK